MEFEPYSGDLLQHLASFIVLAQRIEIDPRGAFEEAAGDLAVDVSVLRRRIQSLASYFESPLLDGRGATMRVTEGGERVFASANQTLLAIERLRETISGRVGRVSIGCTGTVTTELLPQVMRLARQRWPELELHIRRAGEQAAREQLARGTIDLAVIRAKEEPADLESEFIATDQLWLACAKEHALANSKAKMTGKALTRYPQITYRKGSYTRRRVMQTLAGATPRIEVDNKAAALRYVELDLGIAFLSQLPGRPPKHRGVVFRDATRLFSPTSFWIVWRKGHQPRPAEAFIIDSLKNKTP